MNADGEYVFILYKVLETFIEHYDILDNYLLNYVESTLELLKNDISD